MRDPMFERLLVTGEGPTDMGCCENQSDVCTGDDYQIGPVAILISKLLERYLPEWNADQLEFKNPELFTSFVYRFRLSQIAKEKQLIRPSKKGVRSGFVEHAQRAAALGDYAKLNAFQIAAYFHDTDGTRSEQRDDPHRRENLVKAINEGFRAVDFFECGIAVVPKPTSEAWLLCMCKAVPYQHCNKLEDELSGNDRSPQRAPKKLLAEALNVEELDREILCKIARQVDIERIDMNSFNAVRQSLRQAIKTICGKVRD
jgi:hypothetical protein